MTALAAVIGGCQRIGDRCNAILVKEVRQALKSRQFVATFLLLLIASWAGSIFGVVYEGESIEYGTPAEYFFGGFFLALSVASLIVVPFTAFRSIVEERAEHTLDLVQITALSPRQIVWGKLLSAMVQVLVFYSAITPFIAFTALLPGFDFRRVLVSLTMLLIAAMSFSLVALAVGAQARQKAAQVLASLAVVALALGGMSGFFSMTMMVSGSIRFDQSETWWAIVLVLFGVLSTGYLCQEATVAQLTFESDNRSSAMRIIVVSQLAFYWVALVVYRLAHASFGVASDWDPYFTISSIYIFAASLFFMGEADPLSRRVSRGLPRSRFWRLLWTPFLPGGTRGLLYGLLSICALSLIAMPLRAFDVAHSTIHHPIDPAFAWCLVFYLVIFLGAGGFVARFLRRVMESVKAGHIVAILAVILVVGTAGSLALRYLLDLTERSISLVDLFNPFFTLSMVADGRPGTELAALGLAVTALACLAINITAVRCAIREIAHNPVRRQIEERNAAMAAAAAPTPSASTT